MGELKTKYGTIYMPVYREYEDDHRNFRFEREFVKILENTDYDMFVDVGAGWGYHTLVAANHTAHVYAFEPHPKRNHILTQNLRDYDNVTIFKMAVGTGGQEVYFNNLSSRGMIGPRTKRRTKKADIKWITLKDIFEWNPFFKHSVVKIDTEGNELDVVESGEKLKYFDNVTWLIERHEKRGLGYTEEKLFETMSPLTGKLVGTRNWTSHYIFKMEN